MKVSDLLKSKGNKVITITSDRPIFEAMKKLGENKISSLLIMDSADKLIGIISERDIFKSATANYESLKTQKVADLMSTKLIVGVEDDEIDYVMGVMTQNRTRHLPIMDKDKLVGIISIGDIVKFLLHETSVRNRYLEDMIQGKYLV